MKSKIFEIMKRPDEETRIDVKSVLFPREPSFKAITIGTSEFIGQLSLEGRGFEAFTVPIDADRNYKIPKSRRRNKYGIETVFHFSRFRVDDEILRFNKPDLDNFGDKIDEWEDSNFMRFYTRLRKDVLRKINDADGEGLKKLLVLHATAQKLDANRYVSRRGDVPFDLSDDFQTRVDKGEFYLICRSQVRIHSYFIDVEKELRFKEGRRKDIFKGIYSL